MLGNLGYSKANRLWMKGPRVQQTAVEKTPREMEPWKEPASKSLIAEPSPMGPSWAQSETGTLVQYILPWAHHPHTDLQGCQTEEEVLQGMVDLWES